MREQLIHLLRHRPFDTSTSNGRSSERYRRVALTALTSFGVKGVAALASFISIPLTLGYLGRERYGLWVSISSLLAMLTFADLGIGNGLLNAVATASGEDDRDSMKESASSAFFLLSVIALLTATVFAILYPWINWPRIFNVRSDLALKDAGPAVVALVVCFLVSLPFGTIQRIQMGCQEGFINDLWQCAGSLLSLGAVVVAVHLQWGLALLVLLVAGAPVMATIVNGIYLFGFSRPWLRPTWHNFRYKPARTLAHNGFLFFFLQVSAVISFSSDNMIVAQVLGASAVPLYAVAQRVFLLPVMLQTAWLAPLWPAYGEAINRGDTQWVRRTLTRSIVAAAVTAALSAGILAAISRPLFRMWVGPDLVPSWPLTLGFVVWAIVQAGCSAVGMYLNGSNALVFQLSVAAWFSVVAIPLKILFCQRYGAVGIVWISAIGFLFLVAVPYAIRLPKLLARHHALPECAE